MQNAVAWLYLFGEPMRDDLRHDWTTALLRGLLTWAKVVSLFCLLGWVASGCRPRLKERTIARGGWLDIAALVSLVGAVGTMLMRRAGDDQAHPDLQGRRASTWSAS